MSRSVRIRREKLLAAAEGYLELGLPRQALESLAEIADPDKAPFKVPYLQGEALRSLERHAEALEVFEAALRENSDHVGLLMAMAWCYKRTDQLPRAIAAMDQAYQVSPREAVILYNLSCYWSLAGNKAQALSWLGRALRMDQDLRKLIPQEHDFDTLRQDPDFLLVVAAPA